MTYKFLENVAIADVAIEVEEPTIEKLFTTSAEALTELMISIKTVEPKKEITINLEAKTLQDLLYDFLNEIITLKDSEIMAFSSFQVQITQGSTCKLTATLKGEEFDQEKHKLGTDVKAMTVHMFKLWEEKGKWKARFVPDI